MRVIRRGAIFLTEDLFFFIYFSCGMVNGGANVNRPGNELNGAEEEMEGTGGEPGKFPILGLEHLRQSG